MANKIPSTRNTTNNNNNNKNVKVLPESTTILLICVCVCVPSRSSLPKYRMDGCFPAAMQIIVSHAAERAHTVALHQKVRSVWKICVLFFFVWWKPKTVFYSLLQLFVVVVVCAKQTKKKKILFCYTYNKYHWELESLLVIVGVFSVPIMFVRPKKQKLCNSAPVGLQFRWPTTICVVFSFFCSSHSSICEKWMKMTLEASK